MAAYARKGRRDGKVALVTGSGPVEVNRESLTVLSMGFLSQAPAGGTGQGESEGRTDSTHASVDLLPLGSPQTLRSSAPP